MSVCMGPSSWAGGTRRVGDREGGWGWGRGTPSAADPGGFVRGLQGRSERVRPPWVCASVGKAPAELPGLLPLFVRPFNTGDSSPGSSLFLPARRPRSRALRALCLSGCSGCVLSKTCGPRAKVVASACQGPVLLEEVVPFTGSSRDHLSCSGQGPAGASPGRGLAL